MPPIDNLDRKILNAPQIDSSISNVELGGMRRKTWTGANFQLRTLVLV